MKKSIINSLIAAVLVISSCTNTELEPLKGIFPDAQEPVLTTMASSSVTKTETTREFAFKFTGQDNSTVETSLVGARAQYFLESNVYGPGESKGCFLPEKTFVNGKAVKSGSITVRKEEGNGYTFLFVLFDVDGNAIRTKWTGDIPFEPDPEAAKLTQVFTAQSNVASGTNSVTLSLGTAGISSSFDMTTYQTVWSGDGNYLAVDFYSADGYLHEGTYTASAAGGVINEGEFGIGWDPGDLWGIGMVFENWGTCWWTVTGGNLSAEKITSGTITVERRGSTYRITWGDENTYPHWAVFEGEIEALTPSGTPAPDYTYTEELSDAVDNTFAPVAGVKTHNLVLKDKAGAEVAYFQLVLAEGQTDLAGNYTCTEYAHEPYTFGNGYDLSMWGMGMGGTRYVKSDGSTVLVEVGETLTVTKLAEGIYEFTGSTGYDFVAAGEGAAPGGDEKTYVELKKVSLIQDNNANGVKSLTVNIMTDGITSSFDQATWQTTWEGSGNYLAFDIYSADGSLAPGTYTASAVGGTVNEGEFGIGYDTEFWGMTMENWGTCWWTITDGAISAEKVLDGTITVSIDGDVYTIVLESSTVNARYIGAFATE